ncbi:patatin-like phospholipase domain-containing protein 4 isoform X3 [Oryx dammah]|uniref:patatin-like phospholipase domain-containing protein 4 isoform X3 n=1 Tax=Oryx dammah TaxID=59534 RepID=UPI001A9BACDD|nr:patatin-like phospholipase domain-containing protein 4 isoform X3 [Oryx dammah]
MKHINLSFAACGFLGIYHLGAASALCKHGRKLLKDVKAFAGASAGSLVASVLLTAPQKIEECNKFTYDFAEEIRRQSFGALTPGYDFMARLRACVTRMLWMNRSELSQHCRPSDVYEAASHQRGTVRWTERSGVDSPRQCSRAGPRPPARLHHQQQDRAELPGLQLSLKGGPCPGPAGQQLPAHLCRPETSGIQRAGTILFQNLVSKSKAMREEKKKKKTPG